MPSHPLHPPTFSFSSNPLSSNPPSSLPQSLLPQSPLPQSLPPLLHTPSGLAILELQGKINFPTSTPHDPTSTPPPSTPPSTQIGRLTFPLYNATTPPDDDDDKAWMKKVYLDVGANQRLRGEVKALAVPLGVLGRRRTGKGRGEEDVRGGEGGHGGEEELGGEGDDGRGEAVEIKEIVRWKIVFSERPEPVGEGD